MTQPGKTMEKLQQHNATNALTEAEARRQAIDERAAASKDEKGGRGGLDPARYGDWEIKGVASDF